MNKKELKQTMKSIVRECLMEIFAEMHLENIVERVVQQNKPSQLNERTHQKPVEAQERKQSREKLNETLRSKMAVSDQEWKAIYADVDIDIIKPSPSTPSGPEVPEDVLEQAGLMKDYSRFLPSSRKE